MTVKHGMSGIETNSMRAKQKRFPEIVVAVNKVTGTQYGHVKELYNDSYPLVSVSTSGSNYMTILRDNLQILRPDRVRQYRKAIPPYILASMIKNASIPVAESAKMTTKHTHSREECDQFIKGYVPVKAFIDYDSFLTDLVTFVNRGTV
jgi:hypothetical protein